MLLASEYLVQSIHWSHLPFFRLKIERLGIHNQKLVCTYVVKPCSFICGEYFNIV